MLSCAVCLHLHRRHPQGGLLSAQHINLNPNTARKAKCLHHLQAHFQSLLSLFDSNWVFGLKLIMSVLFTDFHDLFCLWENVVLLSDEWKHFFLSSKMEIVCLNMRLLFLVANLELHVSDIAEKYHDFAMEWRHLGASNLTYVTESKYNEKIVSFWWIWLIFRTFCVFRPLKPYFPCNFIIYRFLVHYAHMLGSQ